MLKSMEVKRLHVTQLFPEGNLSVVLLKLIRTPFESMGTCDKVYLLNGVPGDPSIHG